MDFPHFHDLGHKETMSIHGFRWFIAHGTSGSINFIVAVLPLALSSSHGGDAGWVLVSIAHAKVCVTAEALTEPRKPILTKRGGAGHCKPGETSPLRSWSRNTSALQPGFFPRMFA